MSRPEHLKSVADEFLTAALLGEGWSRALEQFAVAADAGGATLLRLRNGCPTAGLSSLGWTEADAEMMAGIAPPSPRRFFPDHVFGHGFRTDQEVWAESEIRKDPYFQEFLRPRGVFYHAKAKLLSEGGERVSSSLKRWLRSGRYEAPDIALLDSLLPELRAAVRIARRVLDAEASGVVRVVQERGDPVFELDSWGRVIRVHVNTDKRLGVNVRQGRLVASNRLVHQRLERAVATAVTAPQRPALAVIPDQAGGDRFLQLVPVAGRTRDVFRSTAAVAVLIDPSPPVGGVLLPKLIEETLGLTTRETQIAALLAEGLSLAEIAERLRLRVGTARNHLKRLFEKSGTRRQGELIALIHKLKS